MAWEVEYAAIRLVYRDDGEPTRAEPPERVAIRIRSLPFVCPPANAFDNDWEPYDHILWLGNDSRACARAGGRNRWNDTCGTKYARGVLSSGGGGQTETGGRRSRRRHSHR